MPTGITDQVCPPQWTYTSPAGCCALQLTALAAFHYHHFPWLWEKMQYGVCFKQLSTQNQIFFKTWNSNNSHVFSDADLGDCKMESFVFHQIAGNDLKVLKKLFACSWAYGNIWGWYVMLSSCGLITSCSTVQERERSVFESIFFGRFSVCHVRQTTPAREEVRPGSRQV